MSKPRIRYPIIVEGKYDKIKLTSLFCADVFATDGFGIFRREDKAALFRRLAERSPLLILTDSDGAGLVIRRFFHSILPPDRQIHLYIPQIEGKEPRKTAPSKAGTLGVEGMRAEILRELLAPYTEKEEARTPSPVGGITKADFYEAGLSGCVGCAERRSVLAVRLGFPADISANALLTALNLLHSREELASYLKDL